MTLGIYNSRSSIARALCDMLPDGEGWVDAPQHPWEADRFLIASGYLAGKRLLEMPTDEAAKTFLENTAHVMALCDMILENNAEARIVVIGSESGISGSYDGAYAAAKAGLHHYVETKRIPCEGQQLVAIAPTIIWDSGMTQRRDDLDKVRERGEVRRRGRWLQAREVAALAYFVLYIDSGSLSNIVIRQHGGNW